MGRSESPVYAMRRKGRGRGRWVALAWGAVAAWGPVASAQSSNQYVDSSSVYTISVSASESSGAGATETICLVPFGGGPDIACEPVDADGIAQFAFDKPSAIEACRFQAVARNAFGDSGLSLGWSQFDARKPGDCNGDCVVNVSDFLCVNTAIFSGQ